MIFWVILGMGLRISGWSGRELEIDRVGMKVKLATIRS